MLGQCLGVIKRRWFLIGIVTVIALANLNPSIGKKGGLLKPEITVKYLAVFFIFFNSGLSLKTEELASALTQFRLHAYIQTFTLLFIPLLLSVIVKLLEASPMDPWLLKGLLVVGSMPPPVSSAVIITKAIGGNEAGAIFNSAFGSFLGIIVTPLWLLYFLGSSTEIPLLKTFLQLFMTVVFPVFVGQMLRTTIKATLIRLDIPFGSISSAILLLIIYTTFCDAFTNQDTDIDEFTLISIGFLVLIFQLSLLFFTFYLSSRQIFKFTTRDIVACMFCSTHKSLTLGIPILNIMFNGHPQLPLISLPLLVYHPTQILLGGIIVPFVRGWMIAVDKFRASSGPWHI